MLTVPAQQDSTVLTSTRGGVDYKGFVKRVFSAGDPSVNHLVIVADNGTVDHEVSLDTDNDYHRITGLGGTTRIYHLLFASSSSSYVGCLGNAAGDDENIFRHGHRVVVALGQPPAGLRTCRSEYHGHGDF